jgi:hypothetical protein
MKPLPQKMGFTLLIVTIICTLLFISGTWGGLIMVGSGHEFPSSSDTPGSNPGTDENPNQNETPGNSNNPGNNPHENPEATPGPEQNAVNPLSGLPIEEEKIRNRPIAIVLSNEAAALPMNGISQADIIYEYLVEGGLTRMMAVFKDITDVRMVGSIRSARHYTVEIAESHDALFVHAGGSPQAISEIRSRGITNFDEVYGTRRNIFLRDRNRISGRRLELLHALVTTNERISEWLPQYDVRTEHNASYEQGFIFSDDATPTGNRAATEVTIRYSAAKMSSFTYDEANNVYHLRQYGRDFIDANNDDIVNFANIIIMKTSVTGIAGDEAGRQSVVTVGSGDGYFVNGGRYIEINWSRADKELPFVYTHLDGTPLELGRGVTFIGIIPTRNVVLFS